MIDSKEIEVGNSARFRLCHNITSLLGTLHNVIMIILWQ
jgi:hypothetical protein